MFLFILAHELLPLVLPPPSPLPYKHTWMPSTTVTLYNNLRLARTGRPNPRCCQPSFLSALEDPDFGFGNVTPFACWDIGSTYTAP